MSFRAVVSGTALRLSPSEERVMNVLIGGGQADATAADVASRAGTHESTVVRLAKKLGYRGYPDLRRDLQRDEGADPMRPSLMRADSGPSLADFVRDEAAALVEMTRLLPQADLDAAAATLHDAAVTYLVSSNDELPTLELFARRLRRLGKVVLTLSTSPKDLAERFVSFGPGSVLVVFALREAPGQLSALVGEAARRGGRTVLVTDVPGYRFRPAPDHLLVARRGPDDEYRTQLVPMALCYALQLAVYHLDEPRYRAVRDGIDDLTRLFGGTGEITLRA